MDTFTSSKTRFLIRAGQLSRSSHHVAVQSFLGFLDSTAFSCLSEMPQPVSYFTHSLTERVTRSITFVLRGLLCPTGDHSPV